MINKMSPIISYLPYAGLLFADAPLPRVGGALCLHPSTKEKGKGKRCVHRVSVMLRHVLIPLPGAVGSAARTEGKRPEEMSR